MSHVIRTREQGDWRDIRQDQLSIHAQGREYNWKRWVTPASMTPNGAGATATSFSNDHDTITVSGGVGYGVFQLYLPEAWIDGDLKVKVYYCVDGSTGGTYVFRLRYQVMAEGDSVGSPTTETQTLSASPSTGVLSIFEHTDLIAVTSSDIVASISVGHNNSGTNTDDMILFGCLVEYLPNKL